MSLFLQLVFCCFAAHTDLMSLIHRLLPVVQLFVQVTFLFTEQILENKTESSEVTVVKVVLLELLSHLLVIKLATAYVSQLAAN